MSRAPFYSFLFFLHLIFLQHFSLLLLYFSTIKNANWINYWRVELRLCCVELSLGYSFSSFSSSASFLYIPPFFSFFNINFYNLTPMECKLVFFQTTTKISQKKVNTKSKLNDFANGFQGWKRKKYQEVLMEIHQGTFSTSDFTAFKTKALCYPFKIFPIFPFFLLNFSQARRVKSRLKNWFLYYHSQSIILLWNNNKSLNSFNKIQLKIVRNWA